LGFNGCPHFVERSLDLLSDTANSLLSRGDAGTGSSVRLVDAHKAVTDLVKLRVGSPGVGVAETECALLQDGLDEIKASNAKNTTEDIFHKIRPYYSG